MSVDLLTVHPEVPTDGHRVYWCWDNHYLLDGTIAGEEVLYIGATSQLRDRLERHACSSGWWLLVKRVSFSNPFPTRAEAFEHERICIAHERPLFNRKGR